VNIFGSSKELEYGKKLIDLTGPRKFASLTEERCRKRKGKEQNGGREVTELNSEDRDRGKTKPIRS